ncbi:MAG: dockerin type I repeat-containing protein [Planctomycetota bacterium]|jgi:hypothetical protein
MPRIPCLPLPAVAGFAVLFLALGSGAARADVIIDEFSDVDIYENPWPYVQHSPGSADIFETVGGGVIQGASGRIRETFIYNPAFGSPGVDYAQMGVEMTTGTFDYTATAGVEGFVDFTYGYVIVNDLGADLSAEKGLRIDLADLRLDPGDSFRIWTFLIDGSGTMYESGFVFVTGSGPLSLFLPFADFEPAGAVDLTDIGALGVSLYAPTGTDFSVERIVVSQPTPGDANADGTVDALDVLALFSQWGDCPGCPADFNDDGVVNVSDFLLLLAHWD